MRPCAFPDLDRLPDDQLFRSLSHGLGLIHENVSGIVAQAAILAAQGHITGPRILRAISDEEAGKFLILIDAVRCPRIPPGQLGPHLGKLVGQSAHLAKGIYAESCNGLMDNFGAHRKWVEKECERFYLDGPNDVDWIFRNQILQRREEAFYVDYVDHDDDHTWLSPQRHAAVVGGANFGLDTPSRASRLIDAMVSVGMTSPEGLAVVAAHWRGITIPDVYRHFMLREPNRETLQRLEAAGFLREQEQPVYERIIDWWPFPLHALTIKLGPDNQQELRDRQARWSGY